MQASEWTDLVRIKSFTYFTLQSAIYILEIMQFSAIASQIFS